MNASFRHPKVCTYYFHQNINKAKPAEVKQQEQEEYNEIQIELKMEAELKEKAKQTRIQNFYKSKTGKLNSMTFYAVKEKQGSRDIIFWHHGDREIIDPDEIIQVMQDWYGQTAERRCEQTKP